MCGAAGGQKLWKRRQNGQFGSIWHVEKFDRTVSAFSMFLLYYAINVLFVLFLSLEPRGVLLSQARSSSGPLDEVAAMRHSTAAMHDEVSKVASFSWRRGTGMISSEEIQA